MKRWTIYGLAALAVGGLGCAVDVEGGVDAGAAIVYADSAKCVEVRERQTARLACPTGTRIQAIDFASYGLPSGSCDNGFRARSCHSTRSKSRVRARCLDKGSCTVPASNAVFADPCKGKRKKLAVVYTCGDDNGDGDDDNGNDDNGNDDNGGGGNDDNGNDDNDNDDNGGGGGDDNDDNGNDDNGVDAPSCGARYQTQYDGEIIVADDNKDEILILEGQHKRNWNLASDTRWRFDISEARDQRGSRVGSAFTSAFSKNKNDAKPVWFEDDMHILVVTNSGDAVALIRLSDKRVVFWKDLVSGGAHSAALLPDGNIVIADSQKKREGRKHGAAIVLSTTTGKMQHCWHAGAHGSVWDDERQEMWVWGARSMRAYRYNGNRNNPELMCGNVKKWTNVGPGGGHDLTPMMDGSRRLLFTSSNGINWFDTRPGQERWGVVDGTIGRGLKSVSYNPTTGEYIYVKAESDSRSDDVRSRSKPLRTRSGGKWYKARWFVPNCFSWPAQ